MNVKTLLLGLATAAMAHVVRERPFGCGTPDPTAEQLDKSAALAAREKEKMSLFGVEPLPLMTVDTFFHVVSISDKPEEGYLTDEILAEQLQVLNDDYAASNVTFVLKNTTRTVNKAWATDSSEMAMKIALRQGDYKTLNVYFLSDLSGLLGYCYFPTTAPEGSTDFTLDGCSILFSSAPNGSATNYNLGKTVTHEVGHWMGLYHTFQGGCLGGDEVDDTPAQSSPSSGCPVGRDSCPTLDGLDPIHNYMDYSYDSCYEEFTYGQAARMRSSWDTYRVPTVDVQDGWVEA